MFESITNRLPAWFRELPEGKRAIQLHQEQLAAERDHNADTIEALTIELEHIVPSLNKAVDDALAKMKVAEKAFQTASAEFNKARNERTRQVNSLEHRINQCRFAL